MTITHAAVIDEPGGPFTIQDIDLDAARPHEVVVRMVAAGLCHTDLSVRAGALPFPLPGVLGHEGAGIVESVGSSVTRVTPGDQVVLTFTSCGRCGSCRSGHPAYCDTWVPANLIGGLRDDGSHTLRRAGVGIGGHFFGQSSFATRALVDERSLVKVDTDVPLEVVAPLGCGIQTGVGAVLNVLAPAYGDSIAVFGAGAVGLAAVIAATWSNARQIIAIDLLEHRLQLAAELGATHTINATDHDVAAVIGELTGGRGVDNAVESTGNTGVLRTAVTALAARGGCAVVGAPPFGAEVALDVGGLIPGKRVIGVTEGDSEPETLIPFLVRQYQAGRLPLEKMITGYDFADINTAADAMHSGHAIKPVLYFPAAVELADLGF
ncbi:NAD(P)-dependent alcohol dehydrogenase [Streptomyces sp. GbtcB6]|uniref:NAD(P)-dependent alcohol dehydrogenase n=1 Tax=Streptomyces sp. GbtcB6 TaxID=2824751 RepID=UPI001C304E9D|nr:NAD(P)-dependent alcohol dehydrogenase [Streptomyces sp. GbtcB6]